MIRILNLSAQPSRRNILKSISGALVLGMAVPFDVYAAEDSSKPAGSGTDGPLTPNVYIALDIAGAVTVTVSRSEMGQGIRTSLAMIMADEMAASWAKVVVRQADGDPRYGDQATDASRSIRLLYTPLRIAAASAREMLEAAAAQLWRAAIADCRAVDHEVIHVPTGRVLEFGQLAKAASLLPVPNPERLRLQDTSARRYVGHPIASIDLPAMIHGKAIYGADIALPGLKYASIERCPVYGGKVKSFDPKGAMAVRGVERVIEIPAAPLPSGHLPLGGVAVIASNSWAAIEGRRKLQVEWDLGSNATHDSAAYRTELEALTRRPGRAVRSQGNFDAAYAGSAIKVSAEYFTPYQAHATMEPPVAIAVLESGKLLVVAPTQSPQSARTVLAQYLDLKEADIVVRPTLLGNGYDRKSMHDFLCEAAWLAKTAGQRIKLIWTREDDIAHDYYQPMMAQRLDGGVDKNGLPIAWRHRAAFASINSTFRNELIPDAAQLGQGLTDMPYSMPNIRCEIFGAPAHMRLGANRAGLNVPFAFATGSFMDELAVAAGKDPATYLFNYLAGPRKLDLKALNVDYPNAGAPIDEYPFDIARLQNVLQFVTDRSGWGTPLLPRQGRGIAMHRSFVSYTAAVVVVTVGANGQIAIPRVDIAIDCGQIVNPDRVRALMEEAVVYGIGLTLYNAITVKGGAVEQNNFDGYRLARAEITPEIRVHVVPSTQAPTGAGDPGVAVIAPAICNAIFAATGRRIRALPVDANLLKDANAPAAAAAKAPLPANDPTLIQALPATPTQGAVPK